MGLPDLSFLAASDALPWLDRRERYVHAALHERSAFLLVLHVVGIVLFSVLLGRLTSPAYFASPLWLGGDAAVR